MSHYDTCQFIYMSKACKVNNECLQQQKLPVLLPDVFCNDNIVLQIVVKWSVVLDNFHCPVQGNYHLFQRIEDIQHRSVTSVHETKEI